MALDLEGVLEGVLVEEWWVDVVLVIIYTSSN